MTGNGARAPRTPLLAWRPPADLAAWAREEAIRREQGIGDFLTSLLDAERNGQPAQVVNHPPVVNHPVRPPRQPRAPRPPPVPPAAAKAPEQARDEPETATCGHAYPDVKYIAGRRVCRKCPSINSHL